MHCQHHDLRSRRPLAQLCERFGTATVADAQAEPEYVRLAAMNVAHRRRQVGCLGDDIDALLAIEQQPQATTHQSVSVS